MGFLKTELKGKKLKAFQSLVREKKVNSFNSLNQEIEANTINLKGQLQEPEKKLNRLEERYKEVKISGKMFFKYGELYKKEKLEILKEILKTENKVSNLKKCVDLALDYSQNLPRMWNTGRFTEKQRIQFYMFPKGIRYNKKLEVCRTEKYNSVFFWITYQQQDLSNKKTGIPELSLDYAGLVVPTGIEPVTQGFSVLCSTN